MFSRMTCEEAKPLTRLRQALFAKVTNSALPTPDWVVLSLLYLAETAGLIGQPPGPPSGYMLACPS